MMHRRFGRTGLDMPIFSTGGMRYQMNWTDVRPEKLDEAGQANVRAVVEKSLSLGLNHIETARGYGTSEYQLGRILPGLPRDSFILQTKVPPFRDPAKFLQEFDLSMELLGVEYVDLLAVHGINLQEHLDWCTRPGGCIDAAQGLISSGRVRHLGFSTHADADVIQRAISSGAFSYVNLHWYYIYQRNFSCIESAARRDMGVFIISPNDKGGLLYRPSEKLRALTQPYSPMTFNDLFCLLQPKVHTLSLGVAVPSDFDEHVGALRHFEHCEPTVRAISARLDGELEKACGREFLQGWYESVPPWVSIPGQANVRVIVWLWLLAKAFDMVEYGKMRYNLIGNGEHWFAGEKLDLARLPEIRGSLAECSYREQIIDILKEAHGMFHGAPVKRLSQSD